MLIIRGVNVFPTQIESVLLELGETAPHYQLIVSKAGSMDALEVQVEMTDSLFSDEVKRIEDLERKLRFNIQSTLAISAKVTLVEPKTIQRSEGKSKRVIDLRKE
jgi:phenylacetate-CoA ligase